MKRLIVAVLFAPALSAADSQIVRGSRPPGPSWR